MKKSEIIEIINRQIERLYDEEDYEAIENDYFSKCVEKLDSCNRTMAYKYFRLYGEKTALERLKSEIEYSR